MLTISELVASLQTSRNKIRAKLVTLGLAQSSDTLDKLANSVDSIENQGAVSATVQEGDTYTIPKGYHNGSGTVSGVAGGGNYSLQSKTVIPTKNQINVTPDSGYYGMSDVTVDAIPEIYQDVSAVTASAGDVLTGKVVVDSSGTPITGTMINNGETEKTIDGLTATSIALNAGYYSSVTVSLTNDIAEALASI